jgi:hypothetical protein
MSNDTEEAARDPRYDVTDDGQLVPHRDDEQEFTLEFSDD